MLNLIPIKDVQMTQSRSYVNWMLILINILVFAWELSLPEAALQEFVVKWGVIPGVITNYRNLPPEVLVQTGGILSLFTSLFIHVGWVHLVGNMLYLYIFGDNIEDILGHFRYLFFYLAVGVCASITHVIFDATSLVPMVGASGAIAGVMGAYFVNFPGARVTALVPIGCLLPVVELPALVFLLVWFATNFMSGVASIGVQAQGGVAFWAHVGGFVIGMFLSIILKRTNLRSSPTTDA